MPRWWRGDDMTIRIATPRSPWETSIWRKVTSSRPPSTSRAPIKSGTVRLVAPGWNGGTRCGCSTALDGCGWLVASRRGLAGSWTSVSRSPRGRIPGRTSSKRGAFGAQSRSPTGMSVRPRAPSGKRWRWPESSPTRHSCGKPNWHGVSSVQCATARTQASDAYRAARAVVERLKAGLQDPRLRTTLEQAPGVPQVYARSGST